MGGFGNGVGYTTKGGASTGGTVTSVGLTAPSVFVVGGSPVTLSGTLSLSLVPQAHNTFFAGPTVGAPGVPSFRTIDVSDIPSLPYVASVGLTAPGIFSVAGSPVTTSGTLSLSLVNQSANRVFAGPISGGPGVPSFRALVASDLPAGSGVSGSGTTNYLSKFTAASTIADSRFFDDGTYGAFNSTINFQSANAFGFNNQIAIFTNASEGMLIGRYGGSLNNVIQSHNAQPILLNPIANNVGIGTGSAPYALTVNGTMAAVNLLTTSAVPSATIGAGAGAGTTVSIGGTNTSGDISISIGTGAVALSPLVRITLTGFSAPNGLALMLNAKSTAGRTFINSCTYFSNTFYVEISNGVTPPANGSLLSLSYIIFPH